MELDEHQIWKSFFERKEKAYFLSLFRRKKISRILAKFAKMDSSIDPRKYRFAKINSREIFQQLTVNSIWGVVPPPLTEKKIVKKTANAIKMIFY